MQINNKVIVVGSPHHNMLGVIRSLGFKCNKQLIFAIVVGNPHTFIHKTRYIKHTNLITIDSYDNLADTLFQMRPLNDEFKPVVICCGDTAISKIDVEYDRLSPFFLLPNAQKKQGEITRLLEKSTQVEIAKQVGFDVPETYLYDKSKDNYSFSWNVFPCIVKPLDILVGGKRDIRICSDNDSLQRVVSNEKMRSVIVQPLISKHMEFQIIGVSAGGILAPGFTRIIRQPYNTNTGYLVYDKIENLNFDMSRVENYINKIGYTGLFSMEFLRGVDGKDYFLEINMRNDGNAYCVTAAGCNLSYAFYHYMATGKHINCSKKIRKTYLIPDFIDFHESRKQKVPMWKWLWQFLTADAHTLLCWRDPGPFLFTLQAYLKRL